MIIKTFDQLTNKELYEILKLRNEVFIVEQKCVYQDIDDKDQVSFHVFQLDKESIIAYVRILPCNVSYKNSPSIGRVIVKKEYRSKGYGKKLMEESIEYIYSKLHYKTITISAQKYLTKFYEELGFNVVSDDYLEDGIPHLKMTHKK